ncbi:cyclic nucleotide-binding domain-containing protein [Alkalinema sp. FACHB-956]|uniref:cyclic nucleotide-binding domain-containing protein n=1 Tax=Alkalinema sp. FACHB-956 TaxID=2692768 RepID=UPI001688A47E|nr:cyclic nucleotide-binding domain-containing protein [Alkalinema sp. FACHB-956]MBD2329009.1 cyclic nucleotide-binding domain-containing protein [Alkalinema sp. FACHB-956]
MRKIFFLLGELSDSDMDWMLYVGRKEQLPAGTQLIEEGHPVDAFYIVLSGLLKVTIESHQGIEVSQLTSGDVVGEISFLDARPPMATVTAERDSLVFAIPRESLQRKLEEDGDFAAHFYRAIALFLADRMRNTVGMLGYGNEYPLESPIPMARELSPTVIEKLPQARHRLETLVKRLRGY